MKRPRLSPAERRTLLAMREFCGVRTFAGRAAARMHKLERLGLAMREESIHGLWFLTDNGYEVVRELRRGR